MLGYTNANKMPTFINYLPIGGRIFYDNGSNGSTYTFYNASKQVISTQTVSGLANAVYYTVSSTPTTPRWYVYDPNGVTQIYGWGFYGTLKSYTNAAIGYGKYYTDLVISTGFPTDLVNNVWQHMYDLRNDLHNGCDDWFFGNVGEVVALRDSGIVGSWYGSVITSNEYSAGSKPRDNAQMCRGVTSTSTGGAFNKIIDNYWYTIPMRKF